MVVLEELIRLPREPNPSDHRVLFFARLGGMGGFVVLSFGCAGLYDGISDGETGEYDSPRLFCVIEASEVGDVLEGDRMEVESMGNELQDSGGEDWGLPAMIDIERVLADGEMTALNFRGDVDAGEGGTSGNGYSNFVESVANGVPTIWDDGECRVISEISASAGIVIVVGLGDGFEGRCAAGI